MKAHVLVMLCGAFLFLGCIKLNSKVGKESKMNPSYKGTETATFAGGCYWCMQPPFENLEGVVKVIAGFAGGHVKDPTYEEVATGTTGAKEAVQVIFYPEIISYSEILDVYWKQFNPTDPGGQFYDRGSQYETAIYYNSNSQKEVAEASKELLNKSGIFNKPIVTKIEKFTSFYPAAEGQQDFYKKDPVRFYTYEKASGREDFIKGVWGDTGLDKYKKPPESVLKKELTPLEYDVTQNDVTEKAFNNKYWNNHNAGIYVDIVTGAPLFCSTDKFDSGTGWPSFTQPIDPRYLIKDVDRSMGMVRIEVRSKFGGSHLGHVFDDGPAPTHLRYCINSAALKFIPKDDMKKDGYGQFLYLFK